MSSMYRKVSLNYKKGWWTKAQVADAVKMLWITAEEYKLITGEDYVPEEA